jgi:hypothetical protein
MKFVIAFLVSILALSGLRCDHYDTNEIEYGWIDGRCVDTADGSGRCLPPLTPRP